MSLRIRRATPEESTAIQAVARSSWRTDYPAVLNRDTIERGVAEWYGHNALQREFDAPNTLFLLAELQGRVVGFAHARIVGNEGDILRLYVRPEARNQGVGTALLDRSLEELSTQGADHVNAMVLAANPLGNSFYQSRGFTYVMSYPTQIAGESWSENTYMLNLTTRQLQTESAKPVLQEA